MTLARTNVWGLGDELTSGQIDAMDINITQALDKRAGQTDTLQSVVTCSGAGRIIQTYVAGTDGNTTYTAGGGNTCIDASTALTAPRNYTLSIASASTGDLIEILGGAQAVTVIDAFSSTTIQIVGTVGTSQTPKGIFRFNGTRWVQWGNEVVGTLGQWQSFTTGGTFTVPAGCYKLLVIGCGAGGGGGGGGGASGDTPASDSTNGGGGGGAATPGTAWINTTPGSTFTVTPGTAGTGGAGGTGGSNGSDGVDGGVTTFGSNLTFYGGQGGTGGTGTTSSAGLWWVAPGGGPVSGGQKGSRASASVSISTPVWVPGQGGWGGNDASGGSVGARQPATAGAYASVNMLLAGTGTTIPGTAGAAGASGGGKRGGGGGGGGGASPFGSGGTGATGSAGLAGPATTPTAAGTAAGGGGGGGSGSGAGETAGNGGNGGGGVLLVLPLR